MKNLPNEKIKEYKNSKIATIHFPKNKFQRSMGVLVFMKTHLNFRKIQVIPLKTIQENSMCKRMI